MSGPLQGAGGDTAAPRSTTPQSGPLNFLGKIEEYKSYMYFAHHALNPARGDYDGPVPDQVVSALKSFLENTEGPMVDTFLERAQEKIDAMSAADIRDYIIDMGEERFTNLYEDNAGVRNVIEAAAKEYVDNTPLNDALKQSGLDLTSVSFAPSTDTSILNTTISTVDPAALEAFFVEMPNNDDVRAVLHQLNAESANETIARLGQIEVKDSDGEIVIGNDGETVLEKIDDINIAPLPENASPQEIADRIDAAIEARIDYEKNAGTLRQIYTGAAHLVTGVDPAESGVFANIRLSLGERVKTTFVEERAKADSITATNLFAMIKNDEAGSLELLNDNLPKIHTELGRKENVLFALDSAGDLVGDALIDFIDEQMQQYPMIAQFAPMLMQILNTVANFLGMDLSNPPSATPEPTPEPDNTPAPVGINNGNGGQ